MKSGSRKFMCCCNVFLDYQLVRKFIFCLQLKIEVLVTQKVRELPKKEYKHLKNNRLTYDQAKETTIDFPYGTI